MDDRGANIQSSHICLLILATCHAADAIFLESMIHYRWSAEIFCLNEELDFQPSSLSFLCPRPKTLNHIDFSSIPLDQNNQIDHQAASHIAGVTIKSVDGGSVLQSMLYSGVIPTAHITYSSPLGRKLDSGETILKVLGMANALNHSQPGLKRLSILYPIPVNSFTRSIKFFLNSVKIGNVVVESFSKEFPVFDHLPTMENSSIEYAGDRVVNSNWHPELSSLSNIMVFPISDEDIIYTLDQFQSMSRQKILHEDGMPQICPNSSQLAIPFRKYMIHLGKAGMHIFHMDSNGQWTRTVAYPGLAQTSLCLSKAKVSPRLYSASMIMAISESRVFVSTLDEEPSTVVLKEVIGMDEKSVCDYLSLSNDVCSIIDIAFDPSACCGVFVLVSNASNSTYILLKHSDVSSEGSWSILTTFSTDLPVLSADHNKIVNDFQLNSSTPARHFILNGMSTLSHPDGVIYMWGDVLLVFDIQSSTLGWIPRFSLNGTANRDTAIQFSSADNKGVYSILTRHGEIWTGISHPFGRPYSRIIVQLQSQEQTQVISTFFGRQDRLFALVLLRNESKDFIRRQEIIFQDESDSNCLSTYNCQKMFLLCQDMASSLHAGLGSFSRTREFFLKPPVLTRKRISIPNWWLTDESGQFLMKWWYTRNSALKQHRKYLHFKNSLPNEPLFTIVLEHRLSADRINYNFLRLAIMQSDMSAVKMEVTRDVGSFDVRYHINLTGQQTLQKRPGESLKTAALKFYPWNPQLFANDQQNSSCCWRSDTGMAFEKNMLVKVGCPPGRRLVFDSQQSLEILQRRGLAASQECFTSSSSLPCFTTSEFVAAFYIEDLVTGERKAFEGNYTLTIVAGGVGYLENIVPYSDSEKEQYNYKPGDNRDSLIWNVLSDLSLHGMQDEATGKLIFDGRNPTSIVFECRMDSPCGSISLGSANPSEYYFEIEASNSGVDSSTNCVYTVKFPIRLIGMQLSPRIHLYLMLITLGIILMLLLLHYFVRCCGNGRIWASDKFGSEDGSIIEDPPHELQNALARRRKTLVGLASSYPRTARRSSVLLSQFSNSDSQKRLTHGNQRS